MKTADVVFDASIGAALSLVCGCRDGKPFV